MCSRQQTETPGKDIHQNSSRKLTNSQGTAKKMLLHLINKLAMLKVWWMDGPTNWPGIKKWKYADKTKRKIFHLWSMWKGIHFSFKPAQAYRHHCREKPFVGPNLCQLWLQFDQNFQLKRHKMVHTGPTRGPIQNNIVLKCVLMLF